jgi:hypothetical protein
MEKYGFVYIWRDRKNNKYYIGSHWGTENDGYICSSNWMRDAFNRRPKDFKRRILSRIYTNRVDTFLEEERYLQMIKDEELRKRYYNISKSIKDHWSKYPEKVKTIREKMSFVAKHNENSGRYKKGYKPCEETKKKISISNTGHNHSEETKKKISNNHFSKQEGYVNPNKGKILSDETKEKIESNNARKNKIPWDKGRALTDEEKRVISEKTKKGIKKLKDKSFLI